MRDTWETTVWTAATTMLRYPDKISDGLEAELYALLEQLGTPETGRPESTGTPDDARMTPGLGGENVSTRVEGGPGPREPGGGAPRGRGARAPGGVTFTGAGQPGATYQTP
jgi:hypothetical protein